MYIVIIILLQYDQSEFPSKKAGNNYNYNYLLYELNQFPTLFIINNKYLLLKLWGVVNNIITDVCKLFLDNILKKYSCFTEKIIFLNIFKKEEFTNIRIRLVYHSPTF